MGVLKFYNGTTHTVAFAYNTTIKTYADGSQKIKNHSYNTLKGLSNTKKKSGGVSEEEKEYQRYKNLYKTKQNIIDLAYENSLDTPWEYFVTLTFDDNKVNARDYERVVTALSKWTDNMKHQNPDMRYILAPELHPTSGRVHFHGIFKNVPNWDLVPARNLCGKLIKKNGIQIYNLINYKYGYTQVSKIQNQEAVSVYISKYITKDLIDLAYKKRFWCSKGLRRPQLEYAYFDPETLKFSISQDKIKKYTEIEKENFTSIFIETLSSLNIYYVNFVLRDLIFQRT